MTDFSVPGLDAVRQSVDNLKDRFGQDLQSHGGGIILALDAIAAALTPPAAVTLPYVLFEDQKADATNGGTFTTGAWRTRDLNQEVIDTDGLASVAANQITLAAGTWDYYITVPAHKVNNHRARLQNVDDATTVNSLSQSAISAAADGSDESAILFGRFTIAAQKTFEVQHQCETTRATDGFGAHDFMTLGVEIFTRAAFKRMAT